MRNNECIGSQAIYCEHLNTSGSNRISSHIRTFRDGTTKVLCSRIDGNGMCQVTEEPCIFLSEPTVQRRDLDPETVTTEIIAGLNTSFDERSINLGEEARKFKRRLIEFVLNGCKDNISATARVFGIDRKTIHRHLNE